MTSKDKFFFQKRSHSQISWLNKGNLDCSLSWFSVLLSIQCHHRYWGSGVRTEGEHMLGVTTRLRWVGHFQRKDRENVGGRMLRMELHGRRSKGRTERRFMDEVKEGMEVAGVREEEAEDRGDGGGGSTEGPEGTAGRRTFIGKILLNVWEKCGNFGSLIDSRQAQVFRWVRLVPVDLVHPETQKNCNEFKMKEWRQGWRKTIWPFVLGLQHLLEFLDHH